MLIRRGRILAAKGDGPPFRAEFEEARKALTEAYEMHPEFPEPAGMMASLAMAVGDSAGVREWFDRAVAAQLDYEPAYQNVMWALRLGWGANDAILREFGLECLATKRFDTIVPSMFIRAVRSTGSEPDSWRDAYKVPGTYERLQECYEGYLAEPVNEPNWDRWKSDYAIAAWASAQYDDAKKLLEELGDRFDNTRYAAAGIPEYEVRIGIEAATGAFGRDVQTAEELFAEKKMKQAAPLFLSILDRNADNADLHDYLCRKLLGLGLEPPAEAAEAVARVMGRLGLREKLVRAYADCLRKHGRRAVPPSLTRTVRDILGEESFAMVRAIPVLDVLTDDQVAAALRKVDRAVESLLKEGGSDGHQPEKGSSLETQQALAEMRVLFRRDFEAADRDYYAYVEETVKSRFTRLGHTGWAMDFMTQHLAEFWRRGYPGGFGRPLAIHFAVAVPCPKDKEIDEIRAELAGLASVREKEALLAACWEAYWENGAPRLALGMSQLLSHRGLQAEARVFDQKAVRWVEALNRDVADSPWARWEALVAYSAVPGHEDEAIRYGQCMIKATAGAPNATWHLTAEALLRKGEVEQAAKTLVGGKGRTNDDDTFWTPIGIHKGANVHLAALLKILLAHPDLSPESRRLLQQTFPEETAEFH